MLYPELANTASATIRAALLAVGLTITPATETYLDALEARTRCWKGIFVATATWLSAANAQEQAAAWQAVVQVCDQDKRPLAAMSRLYYFKNNADALKALWLALPTDTIAELRIALAANPLLLAMFSDPASGVTGLPAELSNPTAAAHLWERVQHKMAKLSRFENPSDQ